MPDDAPPFCTYDFVEHPDQWRYPDIDLSEPVHLRVTCARCAYIREHPDEYPPIPWTTTGEHRPLDHDQLRLAAHVEDDPAMRDELWTAWEAGEDRRHAEIEYAKGLPQPETDEWVRFDSPAYRQYRREKRLL